MPAIDAFQKKVFTCFAFFTPTGGKMIELADNESAEYTPDVQRVESLAPGKGVLNKDVMPARVIGQRFDIVSNRLTGELTQLILSAQASSTVSQSSGTGLTASFSSVYMGQPLDLLKENVTITSVMKGATPLVLGTDYTVDLAAGIVRLLRTSVVYVAGDSIVVTFNAAAVTRERFTSQINVNQYGQAKLILFDTGGGGRGRYIVQFPAQLTCDEALSLSGGNEIVKAKFRLTALGDVIWDWLKE